MKYTDDWLSAIVAVPLIDSPLSYVVLAYAPKDDEDERTKLSTVAYFAAYMAPDSSLVPVDVARGIAQEVQRAVEGENQ